MITPELNTSVCSQRSSLQLYSRSRPNTTHRIVFPAVSISKSLDLQHVSLLIAAAIRVVTSCDRAIITLAIVSTKNRREHNDSDRDVAKDAPDVQQTSRNCVWKPLSSSHKGLFVSKLSLW